MTGRELIQALLIGDVQEDFDLDDEVLYRAGDDPTSNLLVQIIGTTRNQRTPTARPRTQIVLGCEGSFE